MSLRCVRVATAAVLVGLLAGCTGGDDGSSDETVQPSSSGTPSSVALMAGSLRGVEVPRVRCGTYVISKGDVPMNGPVEDVIVCKTNKGPSVNLDIDHSATQGLVSVLGMMKDVKPADPIICRRSVMRRRGQVYVRTAGGLFAVPSPRGGCGSLISHQASRAIERALSEERTN